MDYQLTENGLVRGLIDGTPVLLLPPVHNGTAAWDDYQAWLDAGHQPAPAPAPPPLPDYRAFWQALLPTGAYQALRSQAATSLALNTAATELMALLADAKAGFAAEAAIQAAITAVVQLAAFSEEQHGELQQALASGGLDQLYSLDPS